VSQGQELHAASVKNELANQRKRSELVVIGPPRARTRAQLVLAHGLAWPRSDQNALRFVIVPFTKAERKPHPYSSSFALMPRSDLRVLRGLPAKYCKTEAA